MMDLLRCPHGHQWEDTFKERSSLNGGLAVCPVCASEVSVALPKAKDPSPFDLKGATIRVDKLASPGQLPIEEVPVVWPSQELRCAAPTALEASHPARALVPGYDILGELGRGGMGVVYKARHLALNRVVALKMILAGAHAGERALALFRREAESVARLQHPNIVQIFEVGEQEGRPFLSLEFVDGGSLSARLQDAPPSPHDSARLVEVLARAMHFAHLHGVVHCDLKPANVLLQSGGDGPVVPKITDFGLARQLDRGAAQSHAGATGTPAYMAPEQACCRNDLLGAPTDVYGLGAILYEMLTGRPPFMGETPFDVLSQVTNKDPQPPSRLRPRTPRDLETICLKCLAKAPARRYASALELAEDLRRFIAHEPILARPAGIVERATKWIRRRPTTAALLTVCLLSVLGLAGAAGLYARAQWARVGAARSEVRELVAAARAAGENDAWEKSRDRAAAALAKIKAEPVLAAEFQQETNALLDRAGQRLGAEATFRRFLDLRDDALFHASLATGEGSARNMEAARSRAQEALALAGAADLSGSPWAPDPAFVEKERKEIVYGCYELLLVLAEVEGPSHAHNEDSLSRAENALKVLDRTRGLGLETHAYHLRRARYLKEAGRKAEADEELVAAGKRPPSDALDFFLIGDELYKEGDADKVAMASKAFVSALLLQPDHFWARYFLALCYTRQQQYTAARDSLTTCLGKRPDFVWTYLLRGFVQGQLQDYTAADADFARAEQLLKADPDPDARYVLLNNSAVLSIGRLSIGRKKFAEAVLALQEAIQLKPDQYQAYVSLSQAYRLQKDMDGAARELDRAVAVAGRLVQTGAVDPATLALLYRNRSRLRLEQGEGKEAIEDLQSAVEQLADDPPAAARAWVEMGRDFQHNRDYKAALAAFDAAAKILPQDENALRGRAQTLFQLKRYAECVQALDQFFQQGGAATASLYQARALAKVKLARNEDAVGDYTLALERSPNDLALRTQRGQTYLACQAPQLALLDFEAAIQLDPKYALAYQGRGLARLQLDQAREAAGDAETLARLAPGDARLVLGAAGILAQSAARLELKEDRNGRERPAFRVHCQERAEMLLQEAMRLLPESERAAFWRDVARHDGALAPLRRSDAYREMDHQYGSD